MDLSTEVDSNRRPAVAASEHEAAGSARKSDADAVAALPTSTDLTAGAISSRKRDETERSDTGPDADVKDDEISPLADAEEPDAKTPTAAGLVVILRELGPTDILLGRGALAVRNPGNKHFAQIIAQRKVEYKSTGNRRLKDTIVSQVLQAVRNSQGRFVRKLDGVDEMRQYGIDAHDNAWIEVDVAAAAHKAKQSLRDKDPTLKSKSRSSETQLYLSDEDDEDDYVEQLKKPAKQPRIDAPHSHGDDDGHDTRLVDSKPRAVPSNRTLVLPSAMDTVAGPVSNQYDMTGDRTLVSSLLLNELQRCEQPGGLNIGGTTRHLLAPRNVRDTEAPVDYATLQAILGLRDASASAHSDFTQRASYPAMESVSEPLLFPGSAASALPVVDAMIAEQVRRLQGVGGYDAPLLQPHTLARQTVDPAAAALVEQQIREIVRLTELQDEMQRQRQRQEQQEQLLAARAATLRDQEILAGLGTSLALPFLWVNERQRRNDNDALLSLLHGGGTNQPRQDSNLFNAALLPPSLSNSVAYGSSSSSSSSSGNDNHGRLEPSLAALLAATMPSRSVAAPAVAASVHGLTSANLPSFPNANLSSLTPLQREMLRQRLLLHDDSNAGPDDTGMPNDVARQGPRYDGV